MIVDFKDQYGQSYNISVGVDYLMNKVFFIDKSNANIDYDELERLALEHKPKLIIAGFSCYTQILDFKRFRENI